jgi:outer membrane protein assembly factor BamD (BamD/ComL family)
LREKTRQDIKNLAIELLYNYPNSYQDDLNQLPEKYKKFVNPDNYTLAGFYKNAETQDVAMISKQYQLFDDLKSLNGKSADVIKEFFVESQLVASMTGAGIVVGDNNTKLFLLLSEVQKMLVGVEDKICDNAKDKISIYSKGIADKLNDNIERRKIITQLEGLGYDDKGYFITVGNEKFHFRVNPFDKLQTTALNEKVKRSLPADGVKKQEVETQPAVTTNAPSELANALLTEYFELNEGILVTMPTPSALDTIINDIKDKNKSGHAIFETLLSSPIANLILDKNNESLKQAYSEKNVTPHTDQRKSIKDSFQKLVKENIDNLGDSDLTKQDEAFEKLKAGGITATYDKESQKNVLKYHYKDGGFKITIDIDDYFLQKQPDAKELLEKIGDSLVTNVKPSTYYNLRQAENDNDIKIFLDIRNKDCLKGNNWNKLRKPIDNLLDITLKNANRDIIKKLIGETRYKTEYNNKALKLEKNNNNLRNSI